jgi:hypothetical protein
MTYADWKENYQEEASEAQQEAFRKVMADPELTS